MDEFVNQRFEFSQNSMPDTETRRSSFSFAPGDQADKMPSMSRCLRLLLLPLLALSSAVVLPPVRAAESAMQAAIDKVERDNDGKVLAVQTLERNKRKIYIIKVLTRDGRVKVVQVRASE